MRSTMPNLRGGIAVIAVAAPAAILLAACSPSHAPAIAHVQNPSTATSSASHHPTRTPLQKYFASERVYADCMRAAGLAVVGPDAKGVVRMPYDVKLKTASPTNSKHQLACQAKELPDPRPTVYPPESAKEFAFDKKFAACMREHGVPSYPDPTRQTDPSLPNVRHYEAAQHALHAGTQTFQTALNTCSVQITGHTGQG